MTIKDDIPGLHLNTILHQDSENAKTLPTGFDYEIPLSLNAETCFSEFRNVEKASKSSRKDNNDDENDPVDLSDLLYNAYQDA